MSDYPLLVDTWEGQLSIDESVLKANDVAGIIIRLNDMNGGHHMDTNFLSQWGQAKGFVRAPYFVYNPWVNGYANFKWLFDHIPRDAQSVLLDIEVRMEGYSAEKYAAEVNLFYEYVNDRLPNGIYTGAWFLTYLSKWPAANYWWAQYPYEFYPALPTVVSWESLRQKLSRYSGPSNAGMVPGRLKMWQFSGDRLILPGNPRAMDVNAFLGTRQELENWLGAPTTTPPPTPPAESEYLFGGALRYETRWLTSPRPVRYHLAEIDVSRVKEFIVTPPKVNGLLDPQRTSAFADSNHVQIAINGDEPYSVGTGEFKMIQRQMSRMVKYGTQTSGITISISKDKPFQFTTINGPFPTLAYNAISGTKWLVKDGSPGPFVDDLPPDPRTVLGYSQDGRKMYLLLVDGRGASQGLTLGETAILIRALGAYQAINLDGGGSSTMVIEGKGIVNIPSDGVERFVGNHFGILLEGVTPMSGTAKEKLGKTVTVRTSPHVVSGNSSAEVIAPYTTIQFQEIVDDTDHPGDPAYQWFHLGNGKYAAYIYPPNGLRFDILTPPPPPTPTSDFMTITIVRDGVTTTYKIEGEIVVS